MTQPDGSRVDSAAIGQWGEDLAAQWLRRNGRKVLYRNYRAPGGGEVDIVCRHGAMLTFVEVKTRTFEGRERAAMAVNAAKEKLILKGAQAWLRMLDETKEIPRRVDIVEVLLREGELPKVTVIEGALKMRERGRELDW
ncbi:YraN family protein [Phragmitibacter flavus]|uniref:YraN family protein n=1 Tax=Phragmitibacter flavus TaxID=2576071 RepID=UPI001409CFEB|nr:YraN family protein [Phragmitibacter flavus]